MALIRVIDCHHRYVDSPDKWKIVKNDKGECHNCHQRGHFVRDCTNPKKVDSEWMKPETLGEAKMQILASCSMYLRILLIWSRRFSTI